jgi:hypothetical protein
VSIVLFALPPDVEGRQAEKGAEMKRAACRKASVAGAAKGNRGIVVFCKIEGEKRKTESKMVEEMATRRAVVNEGTETTVRGSGG